MIYAVVIIYNKKCEESHSIQSLMNVRNLSVVVYDNSTEDYGNDIFCASNHMVYYGSMENKGISYAYNYVIDRIDARQEDIVIMLDDDTELEKEYFQVLEREIDNLSVDVFLPIVYADDLILSPSNVIGRCISRPVKDISQLKGHMVTAINSGMAVRYRVFQQIRYDEKLFLDCVDHDFMNSIRSKNMNIMILNCTIKQHYSRNEKKTIEQYISRFKLYKRDFKVYSKKNGILPYYYASIILMRMKAVFLYKSIKLLWE